MEPINFHMPGYKVNEYQLVIAPHEELWNKISKVKDEFAEKYKTGSARFLKPHIALVRFHVWEMMEEKIIQRIQNIAMGITPFKIELKDYGSFPTHTIFIKVTSKLPVQAVVTSLKEAQRLMKMNAENKPHFLEEPHISISRKLKPWQYEQGWLEYSHKQFTGRFIAEDMILLKRPSGEKNAFQIAGRFRFMNLPVSTKQGNLFG